MDPVFPGLSLIIVIAAAISFIMRSIGQPMMIGHIITGIIVGPALLHVAKSPETLDIFSNLGIALLLFIIGLGMNPKVVREVGRASITVGLSQVTLTTLAGWIVARLLGFSNPEAFFLGFGFAISSTIVALKLLSDRKEQNRLYGKLTIGASLVEDIVAAFALLFVASASQGQLLTLGPLIALTFKGLAIGYLMYFTAVRLLPRFQKLIASDQEMLFLFAIAAGLGSAALMAKAGFSLEVGALAAGILLAPQPYSQEIAARLRPLRDFFVIVFFISLGTALTFSNFGGMLVPILVGLLVVVLFKPFVIMTTLGFLGYTKRSSFKTAIALTQVSEFSMIFVVLGVRQDLIGQHIVTILTFIALISIAISTYLVTFSDQIYSYIEKYLVMFERRYTLMEKTASDPYEFVLFGYQKGGHEFVRVFKQLRKKFVVIDYDPEVIESLERNRIHFLYGDATDIELLEEANVDKAKLIVSTITDFETSSSLLHFLKRRNSEAVVIAPANNAHEASELYERGASYVILPHFIGGEKISAFVKKSGVSKSMYKRYREQHIRQLKKQHHLGEKKRQQHHKKLGHTIVSSMTHLTRAKI